MTKVDKRIKEIQQRIGLIWEDKKEEIEKQAQGKNLELQEIVSRKVGKGKNQHRILEGDNLLGLQILKKAKEKFDLIYIDPPYNTGNKDFKYNDSFIDKEDQFRHSKWMSFMYKRLCIAKELMHSKSAIFISIDDAEQARLKLLCDGIFGSDNFVAQFIRKNKGGSGHDSKQIAVEFDYMLCYARDINKLELKKEKVDTGSDPKYRYKDSHLDKRGKYYLRDLDYKGSYSKSLDYPILTSDGNEIYPGGALGKPNTWRWSKEKLEWGIKNDFIVFKKRASGWKVYIKQYEFVDNLDRKRERKLPQRALIDFSNAKGSTELKRILQQDIFSFPKPVGLLKYVIGLIESKNTKVLDFFAGSGTTMQACMEVNEQDQGNRSCTLITNNENKICEEVTYERNRRIIEGFTNSNGKKVNGLKNNQLSYYQIQLK